MARSYKDVVDTSYMLADPDLKKFAEGLTALVEAEYEEIFGLGEVIAKRREELALSQSALAHLAGITQPDLSRLEQGKLNPTYSTIKRVMSALQLRMVYKREESGSNLGLGSL
jgi:ribosome-binding protein aMBF1 (putative translation factor)